MAARGIDRRGALRLAAGVGAALAAGGACAQALMRRPAGDGTVSTFSDGHLVLGAAAGMAPEADPGKLARLFQADGFDPVRVEPPLNVTLLERGDRVILFDAGSGPGFQPSAGRLVAALAEAGVAPDAVTDVVATHAHPDHLWGVLDDFDELTFPQAAYHVPRLEWEFWRDERALSAVPETRQFFVPGARNRFEAIAERVTLIEAGAEVLPGVEAVATPGHTPGHMAYAIHGGEGVMVVGDAIGHPVLSLRRPRWRTEMDQEPDLAVETRLRLLDRLAAERMPVIAYHLPAPGWAIIERSGDAYARAA